VRLLHPTPSERDRDECAVIASFDPSQPGDRIKTDRRDAINLAKLHRTGELTSLWVRDEAYEAIRDLVRARQAGCAPCDKPASNCPGSCSPRPLLSSPVVDVVALALADRPEFDQAKSSYRAGGL
jgi:Transposase